MNLNEPIIARLILKKISGLLSDEEEQLLENWRTSSEEHSALYERLMNVKDLKQDLESWIDISSRAGAIQVPDVEKLQKRPVRSIDFLRKRWFHYAAAIVILIGVTFLSIKLTSPSEKLAKEVDLVIPADVIPGTHKATLTMDNNLIDLASSKKGIAIGKTITYSDGELLSDVGKLLSVSTPKGGEYQVVLPDGTKVWLNAASSISFPSKFAKDKRQVSVSGEVYLEVYKDKSRPFYVDIEGLSTIKVLGTSFNINAYAESGKIKTTLLEGSVELVQQQPLILQPGQQSVLATDKSGETNGNATVYSDVDLEQILAWKNGLFNFNGLGVREVLFQLSRWYDIEVEIRGDEPDFVFIGKMYRTASLAEVLRMLKKMGVQFEMDGKKLIVL